MTAQEKKRINWITHALWAVVVALVKLHGAESPKEPHMTAAQPTVTVYVNDRLGDHIGDHLANQDRDTGEIDRKHQNRFNTLSTSTSVVKLGRPRVTQLEWEGSATDSTPLAQYTQGE